MLTLLRQAAWAAMRFLGYRGHFVSLLPSVQGHQPASLTDMPYRCTKSLVLVLDEWVYK